MQLVSNNLGVLRMGARMHALSMNTFLDWGPLAASLRFAPQADRCVERVV